MAKQVSAIDIDQLFYSDAITDTTAAAITALPEQKGTKIENVHQDTWSVEEAEASQDSYKNQLTGMNYRMGSRTMGDIQVQFTIGRYDMATKKALMGGESTDTSWSRARGVTNIYKKLIAHTEDGVWIVFPYCSITARESNTDGAIGIAMTATVLEPPSENVASEYWFLDSDTQTTATPVAGVHNNSVTADTVLTPAGKHLVASVGSDEGIMLNADGSKTVTELLSGKVDATTGKYSNNGSVYQWNAATKQFVGMP